MDTRAKLITVIYSCVAIIIAMIMFVFITSNISANNVTQRKEVLRVNDRPLLESVQQVYDYRKTGYATFHIGSDYYVVENLPEEYVEYSEWRIRMP